jgi:outer membrane protein OmpA-like peptidoglycan-associated protein
MSRTLTPLQDAIVTRVSDLERMPEGRLRDYLGSYFQGLDEPDDAWCKEFALSIELLVLYGHIRVEDHPRKGRLLINARRNQADQPSETVMARLPAEQKASPWPIAVCAASAVMAAGCSLFPGMPADTPARVAQMPVYGDGTGFPSRIEQFFNGRGMVYRYCRDDECPLPTPKVAAAALQRVETPRYEAEATMSQATQGAAAGIATAATEKLARSATPAVKPSAAIVAASAGATMAAAGKAVGAAAPTMLATLTNKETPPAGIALRTDSDFTSYKGMVGFQQGSMVLDGLSRQKVAEMAPQAREAERVRLRGRVATSQLSEEMKKLAVGRAYAVKVEFVKHDVDKSKIRILSPQQPSGDNATGSVRGVDVMLDMPERKTLSGTVKEGA